MTRLVSRLVILIGLCFAANAAAIDVSYSVSGSAGAWDLEFTVANNLTAWPAQGVFIFGVFLGVPGVTGSPAPFDPNLYPSYITFFDGGSLYLYNNIWFDASASTLLPGTTLSGFLAQSTAVTAPTAVPWFAYTYTTSGEFDDIYTGSDAFYNGEDLGIAGFEGIAAGGATGGSPSSIPEPSTLAMLFAGVGASALLKRKILRG